MPGNLEYRSAVSWPRRSGLAKRSYLFTTIVRPLSRRSGVRGSQSLDARHDLAPVDLERLFLVAVHEVDVELVHARVGQLGQLAQVVVDRADDAEAGDHLVVDEVGIVRADLGVGEIVVAGPVADTAAQRR